MLNAVNGGYAVGIAGMVGFLPSGRTRSKTVSSLGTLQQFEIIALTEATRNVVVGAAPDWRVSQAAAAASALASGAGTGGAAAAAAAARAPRVAFDRSRISRAPAAGEAPRRKAEKAEKAAPAAPAAAPAAAAPAS